MAETVFQEIGMTPLVNESKEVNRIAINRIAEVERERPRAATGKTMWADMVAALPFDYFPGLPGNALAKRSETARYFSASASKSALNGC
jgi:hypothetical protein